MVVAICILSIVLIGCVAMIWVDISEQKRLKHQLEIKEQEIKTEQTSKLQCERIILRQEIELSLSMARNGDLRSLLRRIAKEAMTKTLEGKARCKMCGVETTAEKVEHIVGCVIPSALFNSSTSENPSGTVDATL